MGTVWVFGQVLPLAAKKAQVLRHRRVTLRISAQTFFFFLRDLEAVIFCMYPSIAGSVFNFNCLSVRQQINFPGNQFQMQLALLFPFSA